MLSIISDKNHPGLRLWAPCISIFRST